VSTTVLNYSSVALYAATVSFIQRSPPLTEEEREYISKFAASVGNFALPPVVKFIEVKFVVVIYEGDDGFIRDVRFTTTDAKNYVCRVQLDML
jgi:hypothetical protein